MEAGFFLVKAGGKLAGERNGEYKGTGRG